MARPCVPQDKGLTLLEVVFVVALTAVLAGVAVPLTGDALDDARTSAAARYVAGQIVSSRMDAINRSHSVALRFEASTPDYLVARYIDGNANGVRTAEILRGVDLLDGARKQIGADFPNVRFALAEGLPDADGLRNTGTDGVRIGTAKILTMSPDGTATSGTLYLEGRRAQYAVRVLGATGRTRVLKYDSGRRTWITR
jgi:prepilin-type N-terminal cleavage/methylation domain-containing protein